MTAAWLVGRFDRPDAATAAAELSSVLPGVSSFLFPSPGNALRSDVPPADLVLVVQRRSAEFSRRDAEALLASQSLALIVVGLGPWCESHHRSERLWPEAVTVPLRSLPARVRREARVLGGAAGRVPVTAGRDEMFLSEARADVGIVGAKVGVLCSDPAFRAMLADLLHMLGADLGELSNAAVVLLDADPPGDETLRRVAALRKDDPARRIVALTALPTISDTARLCRAGADLVLATPFAVSDLLAAIGPEQRGVPAAG